MTIQLQLVETIPAPPSRVFKALTTLEGAHDWMPNLVAIERLSGTGFEPGTRWREVRKMFGRDASEIFEVTAYTPEESFELYVDGTQGSSKRGWYRFRYQLSPEGEGTRVQLNGEIGGIGKVMEFIGRLFVGSMKKMFAKDLHALRDYLARTPAA